MQGLLGTPLEQHPPNITPLITRLSAQSDPVNPSLVGAVRVSFPGGDPRALITYYVFRNSGDAIGYSNRHLSLPVHAGRLLAYPPFAQCANVSSGGYCEMVVQDSSIVITTSTSAPENVGAALMMSLAFKHLLAIESVAYKPPSPPVVGNLSACALVRPNEAAAAVGAPVGAPQPDLVGGCSWMSARGGLSVQPKDGGKSQFEFDRSRMSRTQQISGIGDSAFAFRSLAGFVQINVLKGNRYVVIILQGEVAGDPIQVAEGIARTVSSRM